jgi:hypothetical protein
MIETFVAKTTGSCGPTPDWSALKAVRTPPVIKLLWIGRVRHCCWCFRLRYILTGMILLRHHPVRPERGDTCTRGHPAQHPAQRARGRLAAIVSSSCWRSLGAAAVVPFRIQQPAAARWHCRPRAVPPHLPRRRAARGIFPLTRPLRQVQAPCLSVGGADTPHSCCDW